MNNQDYEIDLRKVLFRTCMQWRKIVIGAVAVALLLAGKCAFDGFRVLNDSERFAQEQLSFEREHSSWESQETVLSSKIENLENEKARQEEYNEKSLIMAIDPLDEYYGSFSLYIDSGYKVVPGMSMQNIDYTGRILSAYSRFLTGGELYEYMLANTNLTDEQKYLKEVMSFSVNQDAAMINVNAYGSSADQVQELLTLAKNGIAAKYDTINRTVDDHRYSIVNEVAYSYINYDLQDTQKKNLDIVAEYNTSIQDVNLQLKEWQAQSEPRFQYTASRIVKLAIKKAILGGIVGAVVVFCWFAVKNVLGHAFYEDRLELCFGSGARIIGTVFKSSNMNRPFFIDRIIYGLFGESISRQSFESSCALAGSTMAGMVSGADTRIAIIGAAEIGTLNSIVEKMQSASERCRFDAVGDILQDPNAVNSLSSYDVVAVAAFEKENDIDQISRQFELLRAWNKNILGAIIVK